MLLPYLIAQHLQDFVRRHFGSGLHWVPATHTVSIGATDVVVIVGARVKLGVSKVRGYGQPHGVAGDLPKRQRYVAAPELPHLARVSATRA